MDGLMKGYVLAQWAFWLQQIIVINIEDRRKDHWQMFSHHIITTLLISSCYCYHFTRVGNLILVIMDVVDLFLPVCSLLYKLANHANSSRLPSVSSIAASRMHVTTPLACLWFHGLRRATSFT